MTTYLVLEDFHGPSFTLPAAAHFVSPDDYNVTALRASGLVAIVYVPATMADIRDAFLTQRSVNPAATSMVGALLAGGVAISLADATHDGAMSAADFAKLAALPPDAQSAAQVAAAIATAEEWGTYTPQLGDFVTALVGCTPFGVWTYTRDGKALTIYGTAIMQINGGNGTQLQFSISLPPGKTIDASGAYPVVEGNIIEGTTQIPTIAGTLVGNNFGTPAKLRVGSNLLAAFNGGAWCSMMIECLIQ